MKMKKHLAVLIGMLMLIFVAVIAHLPTSALRTVADDPKPEITEVSSFEQLLAAVNADKTNIKLTTHIMDQVPDDELPTKHRLAFDGGEEYTLDLGGYILCVSNTENIFYTDNFSVIINIHNGHFVLSNSTCFVTTNNFTTTQSFYCVKFTYNNIFSCKFCNTK